MRAEQILLVSAKEFNSLVQVLRQNEYGVDRAIDLAHVNQLLKYKVYDAILLDLDCNTEEGMVLCREIRNGNDDSLLVCIAGCSDAEFRVSIYQSGADSVLDTNCDPLEVVWRLRSMFRRRKSKMLMHDSGAVQIEMQNRAVSRNGKTARLSVSECQIIEFLLASPRRSCSTVELLEKLSDSDSKVILTESAVRQRIRFMKEKFSSIGAGDFISTTYSAGTTLACLGA